MTKSRNILSKRRYWSDADLEQLRTRYPHEATKMIADDLGRELQSVYHKAKQLGLVKTEAYLASPDACRLRRGGEIGKDSRFGKGHVPANKGLRRPGWHRGRMQETQFKKGRPAHERFNYKPIGSLKIADGYLVRKVTDDPTIFPVKRWQGVHRLVWIEAHGPIPDGHVVVFRPGRQTTELEKITLDALELVTRVELMARNTFHRYPQPIPKMIQLRGVLKRKINQRTREREEQDRRPA